MTNCGAMTWGVKGLLLVAGLAVGLGTTAGCDDDDDVPAAGGKPGREAGGEGGGAGTAGRAVDLGGSGSGGVDAGGATTCDCGTDVNHATIPLACACEAGLCTTLADDLAMYQRPGILAEPNYVLLGTCDDGYRTLTYEEATEQRRQHTYDADGHMVYDHFSGYDGILMPKACGFADHFNLGSVTVGADPAKNCSYCLVTAHDEQVGDGAGGGAGATGNPYYPESLTPRCDPSLLE